MLGGMVGNNSSGTTSIKYGVTRDNIVSIKTFLSDGSEVLFSEITSDEFIQKSKLASLEGTIYKFFLEELFPTIPPSIHLLEVDVLGPKNNP